MEEEPGHIGQGNKAWQKSQDIGEGNEVWWKDRTYW